MDVWKRRTPFPDFFFFLPDALCSSEGFDPSFPAKSSTDLMKTTSI